MSTIHVTPAQLRQIADDLEREGANFTRTLETTEGDLVDLVIPDTYPLHYVSADGPGPDATWSVYVEQYLGEDSEPVEGSSRMVSTHATEAEAYAEAQRLQYLITD